MTTVGYPAGAPGTIPGSGGSSGTGSSTSLRPYVVSTRNNGGPHIPQEIVRTRNANIELLMSHGQPVLHMHMFSLDDLDTGFDYSVSGRTIKHIPTMRCPSCWDRDLEQGRGDCPVCHGVFIVSAEEDPTRWITEQGRIVDLDPGTGVHAPRYQGYGPPTLTWVNVPDAAEDFFKISQQGVLVRIQNARAQAPWTPNMSDNDILVTVDLAPNGFNIIDEGDRYQLKMTNPQTMRGFGANFRAKRHQVGQEFEMVLVPRPNLIDSVPIATNNSFRDGRTVTGHAAISGIDSFRPVDADTVSGISGVSGVDTYPAAINSAPFSAGRLTINGHGFGIVTGMVFVTRTGPITDQYLPFNITSWNDTQIIVDGVNFTGATKVEVRKNFATSIATILL